jgi:exodeoxyribonuclease VII large subunit
MYTEVMYTEVMYTEVMYTSTMALEYDAAMSLSDPFSTPGVVQPPGATPRDVLSVTSLNRLARSLLESSFPSVLVEGEISNFSVPGSGHWYLTLKDAGSQIRCAMFRNRNMTVRFRPGNGAQVIVRGRLSIYEGRGDYQLIIDSMEPAGAGALQRAFEELKAKLAAEGLFDQVHKKAMPEHCCHAGVITSGTGAAFHDILSVFGRRFPAIRITLLPVSVQGAEAPTAIVRAIETANRRAKELGIDVLIVGRGGGSLEDLQAFNQESVARAIFASELPIVSAVGHEIDFTIADFVADLRAPTPSAAAELLSPDQEEYFQLLAGYELTLQGLAAQRLNAVKQQLLWLLKRLKHPGRRLQEHAQTLDMLEGRLLRAILHRLRHASGRVRQMRGELLQHSPVNRLKQFCQHQSGLQQRLHRAARQLLKTKQAQLLNVSRGLDAVSPLYTLSRGYSITYDEQSRVVRDSRSVTPGSRLSTVLKHGRVYSQVTAMEHGPAESDNTTGSPDQKHPPHQP